ncbi:myoneurin [Ictalurus furcatus]|uniref:myoneurin n=1 Tax=Ictalurus furcatus TaxID=66913 RepID=UPI00234FE200|nr:myoneurin [Ictalurus furcatus]
MSKLEQLNVFLSERLSAAVNEILDTVSRMMQEYEEETARIRKENDYLKEMLKITGWSFTEINPGVFLGEQDGLSNLQHDSQEGLCQNPELKEESTSIKIEQPDPPYPAHPDSEHTFPVPAVETGSPISDVWNRLKNSKRKAKLKLKKKHYCLYCKKPSLRMTQHLLSAHAREPEVAKALSYDKKSKERKQLLDLLQSKGNLLHKDVGMSKTLMSSELHATAGSNKDNMQCIYCLGLYSSKSIANHVKRCKHKYPYRAEASTASPVSNTIASRPGTSLSGELLPAKQVSLPRSCSTKQETPNPESVSTPESDTRHCTTQLYADPESTGSPCENLGLVGEQLLANLESQSDLAPDTSMVRHDHVHNNPTCSSPTYDQTETSKSEHKKTDADQSSQNGHTVEWRRSSHVETQSRVIDNPSDEEASAAQNAQLHICQHCNAAFCSAYHLRRHEYTHTDERPFWCSECNIGFIQKYRYRNHRMIHHEERHLSIYKDQSRRRKNRSSSGEKSADSELHQQPLAESTAGTSEPSNNSEERV